ncbi:putative secologanin synthase [Helianthus annuus]|uniref:Secologanin synthase n=1 Tax=Helianthus annuus TaxID=4232 RepID=A0A9K3ICC4_HELAN|nr:putative secologanin synthase [Helianthus annuus]KAJ0537805.1 putative secologanin synthase [Helianthus annuus]KAJ0552389.1 putative secologanin synthase [Helianthus annuus]KAJ0721326.1 putative secologanin synthase [Helianthus annuus]KAJ0896506.1 putative secologanin synthase [Helianthus annuus]
METIGKFAIAIVVAVMVSWGWKLLNWVWLKPKKLEKWLRDEGYKGNPYKLLMGDMIELATMVKEGKSKPIPITHDITSYTLPFDHHIISKYDEFQKTHPEPFRDSIIRGLLVAEGDKWTKHRKIINPAFSLQSLKIMFSAVISSCSDMIHKWELLTTGSGSTEIDVWPYIDSLGGDMISRTAFGSSYKEGWKIFRIQKEQIDLLFQMLYILFIPGSRFIPTRANKKFKENDKELRLVLMGIINKRKKAIETGEGNYDDLLGLLLESNKKEIDSSFMFRTRLVVSNIAFIPFLPLCFEPVLRFRTYHSHSSFLLCFESVSRIRTYHSHFSITSLF